jgi:PAS domain S-box-containing protein
MTAPVFSLPTLSTGDVPLSVGPLPDRARLDAFVGVVSGIRGVERVVVDRFDGVESLLTAHLDRPTAFAGDLRAALGSNLASCTTGDGRLIVVLASAPDAPRGTKPPTAAGARADGWLRAAGTAPGGASTPTDGAPPFADLVERDAATRAMDELPEVTVLTFDRELRFTSRAGGLYAPLGRSFEAIRGRPAYEVVRPATWAVVKRGYEGAIAGRSETIDFPGLGGDSIHESAFSPLMDGTTLIGGTVITRDVTEARRSARLLDELNAVLRVTFDLSPIGHALVTPDGRWARVNAALQRTLGADEAGLVARRWQDLTHPDDLAEESALVAELLAGTRDHYSLAKRFLHADGHEVPVMVTTTLLRSADGQPHGLVCQVADQAA